METESAGPTSSSLEELAIRIREEHTAAEQAAKAAKQADKNAFDHAVEAGRTLIVAKDRLGHGEWGGWLKKNCEISERQAQRYMQIARGADQIRHTMSDLPCSSINQALKAVAKHNPERPRKLEPKEKLSSLAWSQASLEKRRHFIDGIGKIELFEAVPESWYPSLYEMLQRRLNIQLNHAPSDVTASQPELKMAAA